MPTAEEYNRLRQSAGWGSLDVPTVERSLPNSVYAVCVEYNHHLIGFGRVVGDGGLCFYIQEIIIVAEHRGNGVGSNILDRIMNYIDTNATKRSYVAVMVGKELEGLYSKHGFWARPNRKMGPGMMQFWDDPEFNKQFNHS